MDKQIRVIDLEDEILKQGGEAEVIAVGDQMNPERLLIYALDYGFGQIVQKSSPQKDKEMEVSQLILRDRAKFINYPISSVLEPSKASEETEQKLQLMEFRFDSSTQKMPFLKDLEAQLKQFSKAQSFIYDVCVVADELFSNAVYNASFVDLENILSGMSRELPEVKMKVGHSGRMFVGCDDTRLVLGCEDSLGTLNLKKQMERVKDCYEKGVGNVINLESEGGAGIGSFIIFNNCMSYYAVVDVGVRTTICCTFPLKSSQRKRGTIPKNLHVN